MDYGLLKDRIEKISNRVQELDGMVQEVVIDEPATLEEIEQMEADLGVRLPKSFRQVLTEFSKNFSLRWFLPEDLVRPEEFREIFAGMPNWSLDLLSQYEDSRKGYIEVVCPNPEDPYDAVWHNKLAFCDVGNGDYLAFDLQDNHNASIVYLSHAGGEGHGFKVADNFKELLENWSKVGFVGPEDWQWRPFTTSRESGIEPEGEAAVRFRSWLGFDL